MNRVLDAWALLAWLKGEGRAARQIRRLLLSASRGRLQLIMGIVNLGEVYCRIAKDKGEPQARSIVEVLRLSPITIESVHDNLVFEAASLKARYPISYADAFAAALTMGKKAVLVTGDPDFKVLEKAKVVPVQWLPRR